MKKKAPVLTSPSKIGFFVSLMLVLVSIGVTYFFMRRFGITWNLLDQDWLDRDQWLDAIRGQGVLFEMLPLIGLVAVTSMFGYLVITSAVRNYKKYLDSGHDYRNLLASLKDLEELEDKRKIERIKNHPELKRLLLGLVETIEQKERLLKEREDALQSRVEDGLAAKQAELSGLFEKECDRLSAVLESGKLVPTAIDFSNPGLRKLSAVMERAMSGRGDAVRPGGAPAGADGSAAGGAWSAGGALSAGGASQARDHQLRCGLREAAEELELARSTAQTIEARLRALGGSPRADDGKSKLDLAGREILAVITGLASLEQLNLHIDSLSEEARGIAINTALHAGSGMGSQEDIIRLAEEVKEIAARFKDAAKQFAQTSSTMRSSAAVLDTIAGAEIARPNAPAQDEEDLSGVLSQISLWVERTMVLSDKVAALLDTLPEPPAAAARGAFEMRPDGRESEPSAGPDGARPGGATNQPFFEGVEPQEFSIGRRVEHDELDESLERSGGVFCGETAAREYIEVEAPQVAEVEARRGEEVKGRRRAEERGGMEEPAGAQPPRDTETPAVAYEETLPEATKPEAAEFEGTRPERTEPEEAAPEGVESDEAEPRPAMMRPRVDEPAEIQDSRTVGAETEDISEPKDVEDEWERPAAWKKAEPRDSSRQKPEKSQKMEEEPVDLYDLGAVDYDPALHG